MRRLSAKEFAKFVIECCDSLLDLDEQPGKEANARDLLAFEDQGIGDLLRMIAKGDLDIVRGQNGCFLYLCTLTPPAFCAVREGLSCLWPQCLCEQEPKAKAGYWPLPGPLFRKRVAAARQQRIDEIRTALRENEEAELRTPEEREL